MQQGSEQSSFQIVLESEGIEELTDYWQNQCYILYNSLHRNLREGSIEPLCYESGGGDRGVVTLFSTLVAVGMTSKAFEGILNLLAVWLENRPRAKFKIKCPDGSTFQVSNLKISDISKFTDANDSFSICERLALIK